MLLDMTSVLVYLTSSLDTKSFQNDCFQFLPEPRAVDGGAGCGGPDRIVTSARRPRLALPAFDCANALSADPLLVGR